MYSYIWSVSSGLKETNATHEGRERTLTSIWDQQVLEENWGQVRSSNSNCLNLGKTQHGIKIKSKSSSMCHGVNTEKFLVSDLQFSWKLSLFFHEALSLAPTVLLVCCLLVSLSPRCLSVACHFNRALMLVECISDVSEQWRVIDARGGVTHLPGAVLMCDRML